MVMPASLDSPKTLKRGQSVHGEVVWQSPSNIALVKYWGKRPVQLPENPSLSFTLSTAHTVTSVSFANRDPQKDWISFFFDGKANPHFALRIERFLKSITSYFPFLDQLSLEIKSHNSFPHSSGIASSASALSALALCICDMERIIFEMPALPGFYQKASLIGRLGSGSACRSVFPQAALWGRYEGKPDASSDTYAVPFKELNEVFLTFRDDILIVSSDEKSVSSSAGHRLMETNWFAKQRYIQARSNLGELIPALRSGDLEVFGRLVENEALTLHALMMCSDPSYLLMRPGTVSIIEEVRSFRKNNRVPVFFTLDAGPNVHLLYPLEHEEKVRSFIKESLMQYTESGIFIRDYVGDGPIKLPSYGEEN